VSYQSRALFRVTQSLTQKPTREQGV
jgi:hypothetical protein